MRTSMLQAITKDTTITGPFILVRDYHFTHLKVWELRGQKGNEPTNWYLTFRGNSKQRRQQRRKLIRELNK